VCFDVHPSLTTKTACTRLAWYKANTEDVNKYSHCLRLNLDSITVPVNALGCRDVHCCNELHSDDMKNILLMSWTHA